MTNINTDLAIATDEEIFHEISQRTDAAVLIMHSAKKGTLWRKHGPDATCIGINRIVTIDMEQDIIDAAKNDYPDDDEQDQYSEK